MSSFLSSSYSFCSAISRYRYGSPIVEQNGDVKKNFARNDAQQIMWAVEMVDQIIIITTTIPEVAMPEVMEALI